MQRWTRLWAYAEQETDILAKGIQFESFCKFLNKRLYAQSSLCSYQAQEVLLNAHCFDNLAKRLKLKSYTEQQTCRCVHASDFQCLARNISSISVGLPVSENIIYCADALWWISSSGCCFWNLLFLALFIWWVQYFCTEICLCMHT